MFILIHFDDSFLISKAVSSLAPSFVRIFRFHHHSNAEWMLNFWAEMSVFCTILSIFLWFLSVFVVCLRLCAWDGTFYSHHHQHKQIWANDISIVPSFISFSCESMVRKQIIFHWKSPIFSEKRRGRKWERSNILKHRLDPKEKRRKTSIESKRISKERDSERVKKGH